MPLSIASGRALGRGRHAFFVGEGDKVLVDDRLSQLPSSAELIHQLPAFELAGPRNRVFFDSSRARAGIVTCGGLCPGLNNVIRGLVLELWFAYGIKRITGFRYGYEGLIARGRTPEPLTPETVSRIHHQGGTILGSSRGEQDPANVVDSLEALGINMLFVIGGDGTIRGPMPIIAEIEKRGLSISVVGVPKTIDNDIHFIDRSFGFESVHAAMAGNTEMLIWRWHGRFVHVPMPLATRNRKQVDPGDDVWTSVIEATGQPRQFV